MRFINDDVKLKNGGRKAIRTTKEQLHDIMLKQALRKSEYLQEEISETINWEHDDARYQIVMELMQEHLSKDNKFDVDMENPLIETNEDYKKDFPEYDIGEPLMGFNTLPNGLTFYGFIGGGDWECGVYMIIYYDGKKLRSYTPSYGNCVNLSLKCAFGSEGYRYDIPSNYEDLVDKVERNEDEEYEDWEIDDDNIYATAYLSKYEQHIDKLGFNWDAMKEDILARIIVE